ncbi:MAG: ATP-binding cassette domain-containing protein [Deltaproteobacteria bacterium]|jgi:phospholipid/cholesterol/gamma-HCH transport system ATP-binding protein|nr:ATP-binding cassette domain-containing protein [Deltaproteobacteria bacterium]
MGQDRENLISNDIGKGVARDALGYDPNALPLEVIDMTVAYPGQPPLLEGVSFKVEHGEILGILGPSGCGKSSLLRHLVGLEYPRRGTALVLGEDIFANGEESLNRARHRFGVMYQSGALFGDLNLLDNVAMPLKEYSRLGPGARKAAAALKLALVGLSGFEYHMPAEISGGMRKRAAIARALALEPSLLFLDEPGAGLDPVTATGLDHLILTLSRNLGLSFVVVTHELRSILTMIDRAILLDKTACGIADSGTPKYLAEESEVPAAKAFFLRDQEERAL